MKYSFISTTRYLARHMWKENQRELLFTSWIQIISEMLIPFLSTMLPSLIIGMIESQVSIELMMKRVILYVGVLLLVTIINKRVWLRNKGLLIGVRGTIFSMKLIKKNLDADYMVLENSDSRKQIDKVQRYSIYTNELGFEGFLREGMIFLSNILGFIVYCILLSSIAFPLALFIMGFSLLSLYFYALANRYEEKNKQALSNEELKMNNLRMICKDLGNAKDVRLYSLQGWFDTIFSSYVTQAMKICKKINLRKYGSVFAEDGLTLIREVITYAWLINAALNGLSLSEFTFYLGIIGGFSSWLQLSIKSFNHMRRDHAAICDYRDYVDSEDQQSSVFEVDDAMKAKGKIVFDHVSFTYKGNEKPTLDDFNLIIKDHEKVSLVGMNGAGKTTLVKLLSGLYKPNSGAIYFDGINLSKLKAEDIYAYFSVVFQDVHLFAFSVKENVACCANEKIDEERVNDCLKKAGIYEKIMSLPQGINTPLLKEIDEDGVLLSGGETQKLMLARALYKSSDCIILDEPTAALDAIAEEELYNRYSQLTGDKTSIFVSHRLSSSKICDRVLFMVDGKIIEDGNHAELLAHKKGYAQMFELQAHYYQERGESDEEILNTALSAAH